MGLLDQLSSLNPEQTQGLLAAAAQILQQSGDSRRPFGAGQALGSGIEAYQGSTEAARQRKLQEQQAAQMAQMRDLQMQEQRQQIADQSSARERQQQMDSAARDSVQQGGLTFPTSFGMPEQGASEFDSKGYIDRLMKIDPMKAMQARAQFAPKAKELKETTTEEGADGKPVRVNWYKDGSHEIVTGITPRTKKELMNLGGKEIAYDPYALTANQEFQRTQSPDNAATVGASYANANATREIAKATRDAATIQRDINTEMKLGDDYRTQSKGFKEVSDAYRTINATLDKATMSPAATLAGATKFMKLLDPGSVVRESELGMALAASGVFDRATNYHNTLLRGKVLTANQVADFKEITKQIYAAAQQGQQAIDKSYTTQAKAYNLRPEMVVQDLGQNARSQPAAPIRKSVMPNQVIDGYRFKGGDPSQQSNWEKL
jgi:hypothetical protein